MRSTRLLILLMLFGALYALVLDIRLGMAYLAAVCPLIVFQYALGGRLERVDQLVLTVSILSVWAFYLLRPMLLFSSPELFKFISQYRITPQLHQATLLWIALSNLIFVGAVAVVLRLTCAFPTKHLFRQDELLYKFPNLYIVLLASGGIYVLASLLAIISPETGGRILSMLELALPVEFIAPFALAVLVSVRRQLSRKRVMGLYLLLGTYFIAQFFQGSKSFLLEIVYIAVVLAFVRFGDFEIPVRRVLWYLFGLVALFFSFPIAMAVRRIADEGGLGGISLGSIIERVQFMGQNGAGRDVLYFSIDLITKRLNGYDGSLAVAQVEPSALSDLLNMTVLLENSLASTLPGIQSQFDSFGSTVSHVFYPQLADLGGHGGAVGAYAMLSLLSKNDAVITLLATALYGAFWAAVIALSVRIKAVVVLRYVVFGGLVMTFSLSTNGGNFDRIFREVFAMYFHFWLMAYYVKVRFLGAAGRTHEHRQIDVSRV